MDNIFGGYCATAMCSINHKRYLVHNFNLKKWAVRFALHSLHLWLFTSDSMAEIFSKIVLIVSLAQNPNYSSTKYAITVYSFPIYRVEIACINILQCSFGFWLDKGQVSRGNTKSRVRLSHWGLIARASERWVRSIPPSFISILKMNRLSLASTESIDFSHFFEMFANIVSLTVLRRSPNSK